MLTNTFDLNPHITKKFDICKIRKFTYVKKVPLLLPKGIHTENAALANLGLCIAITHAIHFYHNYLYGLVQDCNISNVLAMEILQFCTKPYNCSVIQQKIVLLHFQSSKVLYILLQTMCLSKIWLLQITNSLSLHIIHHLNLDGRPVLSYAWSS